MNLPSDLVLGASSSGRADGLLRRCAALGQPTLQARFLCAGIGVQQTVVHRIAGRSRRVLQAQPVHHLEAMLFDGLDAAPEIPGNSLAGISQRNAYQHLTFARRHVGHLHLGDKLEVKYPDETEWHEAAVTFRAPVVDAASDTQLVKLTLPNPTNRDSGLQIQVQLPPEVADAAETREKTAAGN